MKWKWPFTAFQHRVVKCKKSLHKSTYGRRRAFKAGHTYVIASVKAYSSKVTPVGELVWVIDELGNEISFLRCSDPVKELLPFNEFFFENSANR